MASTNLNPRIFVLGDIDTQNSNELIYFILKINEEDIRKKSTTPIKLIVNSKGGDVNCAFGIIDVIENSKTPIYGYIYGSAMSAAMPIFCSCHERYMSKNSTTMYHDIRWGVDGSLTTHKRELVEGENMIKKFDSILINKTKLTQNLLDKIKHQHEDKYFNSKESLKYNITNHIIL